MVDGDIKIHSMNMKVNMETMNDRTFILSRQTTRKRKLRTSETR